MLWPGVFGAHELFHFFVIAGSACHVLFMLRVVVPARAPAGWLDADADPLARSHAPALASLPLAVRPPLASSLGRYGVRLSLQLGEALFRRPNLARQRRGQAGVASGAEPAAVIPTAEP